ncbi:organic solute transporter Ostalpha [Helicosporidium sp. ATCC 50920]|nr:organic solute transporter Ostalpha [Helicosporidium sp. ATCC 50920]|eukprot:KDD73924.1 organic solute transporter Ostalpha [Helicosporidium sp. ATCC 50920]
MAGIPMRRVFRGLWVLLTLATFSALPWMIVEFKKEKFAVHYQAWFIAGIFAILATSASIYEVAMHLEHYNRPRLQIRVVRILCMVPIYALDSWLSLRFVDARFFLDPLRECYEAFVIYNFYAYLMAYLEDEFGDVDAYYAGKPQVEHLWPVKNLIRPWPAGARFFAHTKRGVLAYVIARPLCTAVSVLAAARGVLGEGDFRGDRAYPYLALVGSVSQTWALYCLILMYRATRDELAPLRPLSKFLVIKAVVFFSFWQSVGIALAAKLGVLHAADWSTYDTDDTAASLQNFLICIEMFGAAVAHAYAFPPREYMDPAQRAASRGFLKNVRHVFDVSDVVDDVHDVVADAVSETTEGIADVGRRTWESARGLPAHVVSKPEHIIKGIFGRSAGQGASQGGAGSRSGSSSAGSFQDASDRVALLPESPRFGALGTPPRSFSQARGQR